MTIRLDDTYYLPRAGRYANPLNSNDRLPLVYGDLTDGSSGNWALPCIDTVNHVYCFSAAPVISVALGNTVNIYADNVLVTPANYTFDESDDYESQGNIAKITFSADQGNAVITARGKGKVTGSSLMENVVDQIYDFLTVENDLTSLNFDTTARARAREVFEAQGYKAAGVIAEDMVYWEIILRMMSSFLGSAYLSTQKLLYLDIDDGTTLDVPHDIIPKADIKFVSAKQRLSCLVNRCPASYAYNYAAGDFRSHTNDNTYGNIASQGIYGTCQPNTPYQFYWCRDKASVNAIQAIITEKFGTPTWEIELIDIAGHKRDQIDCGAIIAVTVPDLINPDGSEFINQLIKIIAVTPDYQKGTLKYRALDTRKYLTVAYIADGSYLADGSILAGGERDLTDY